MRPATSYLLANACVTAVGTRPLAVQSESGPTLFHRVRVFDSTNDIRTRGVLFCIDQVIRR